MHESLLGTKHGWSESANALHASHLGKRISVLKSVLYCEWGKKIGKSPAVHIALHIQVLVFD